VRVQPASQAEIGGVRLSCRIQQNVGGFQIAVQDAALVSMVHRARDGHQQRSGRAGIAGVAVDLGGQVAPFHQPHAEVRLPGPLPHFVNGNDMRMIQLCRGFRFVAQTFHFDGRGQNSGADHLQRHQAAQRLLTGKVDNSHTATAQQLHELVVAHHGIVWLKDRGAGGRARWKHRGQRGGRVFALCHGGR
jgi:hypothetical protein